MNKKFTKKRKALLATLCAVAVTCTGLAAACAPEENTTENPSSSTQTNQRADNGLPRNGSFEYFNVPDGAEHLIRNMTGWTRSGDSSGTMSGIIDTSETAWEKMTDAELRDKLDKNNDLSSSDPDYDKLHVDYNGMKSSDLLYVDSYAASKDADGMKEADDIFDIHGGYEKFMGIVDNGDGTYTYNGKQVYPSDLEDDYEFYYDTDFTQPVRYSFINNPETHLGSYEERDGKYYLGDTQVYLNDNGSYFLDEEFTESTGNVLMIHNYPNNTKYNGITQHYASQSITLEANTAAEISLWVKTAELKFDKGYRQIDDQDRGAYIEIAQTVGNISIDSFKIKAINTEKIIRDNADLGDNESNGWLKYTIYINACDFASSTVTINLGLGDSENSQKVTGYAFFDDVTLTKFIDFDDVDEDGNKLSTYEANKDKLALGTATASYCSLTSEADDKIFIADREVKSQYRGGEFDDRFSTRFHYLIDLASEDALFGATGKQAIDLNKLTATASLTVEKSNDETKNFASATSMDGKYGTLNKSDIEYTLSENFKGEGLPTFNDLIGIYTSSKKLFGASDFGSSADRDLSGRLNSAITGDKGLKALENFCLYDSDSMVVILSAYGASYTVTFEDSKVFTVDGYDNSDNNYQIISFWVKTSDLKGHTAATLRLVDVDDEDNVASFDIDTTKITTDVDDNKNIYNDWVQCFFFVHNDTPDSKTFKLEFSFGTREIMASSNSAYKEGWAAMANVQSLAVTEDVFKLVPTGSNRTATLTFTETKDNSTGNKFDSANRMTDIKKGVATPNEFKGINGGSSYVTDRQFGDDFDRQNNFKNGITGLINRDYFENEGYDSVRSTILNSFISGAKNWDEVFGKNCYQPLIIVNSLREYTDRSPLKITEENFEELKSSVYVKNEDGTYSHPTGEWEDHKNDTFYSETQLAKNYGYMSNSRSISSNSYATVSIRVMVSEGATAFVYLVDPTSNDVMNFATPSFTFFYDDEGNVLETKYTEELQKDEAAHRNAIVYNLRDDGLYEDKDGKIFANLHNLTKRFKYSKFENNSFYKLNADGTGEAVSYEDLEDGETYYSDKECTKVADHYLVVGTQRIYEFDAETQTYYYLVEGKRDVAVNNFDTQYARYEFDEENAPEYCVKVEDTHGKWVTVNFNIRTGNEAKAYRLELWSGSRYETGVTDGMTKDNVKGAVAFDYSNYSISSEANFVSILGEYEQDIINVYRELIKAKDATKLSADLVTISDYEKVLEEIGVTASDRSAALEKAGLDKNFVAQYYTFTWYDSAQFVPFNAEVAESGVLGYKDVTISDTETLVYFSTYNEAKGEYNTFIDYSAVDQTVTLTDNSVDKDDDHDHTTEEGESPWLLITSIILVVVLLFVLLALFARQIWLRLRKRRSAKDMQKNNYKKRQRYMRKLGLVKTVDVEEKQEATPTAAPAETAPVEKPAEETPVEEAPAEEVPAEETPAEEAPAEETPAEETPADDNNQDE